MSVMSRAASLWRNLIRRDRVERDLDEELRTTLDLLVDEKVEAGLSPSDARRAAMLELDRVEAVKDRVRDARAGAIVEGVVQDLRYAARLLRRNPDSRPLPSSRSRSASAPTPLSSAC